MKKAKNILITGASTGIGYDLAKAYVEKGYQVYGSVRKQADADRLSEELGQGFEPLLFDVTDYESVDNAAQQLTQKLEGDGLGGLINNAGVAIGGPFMDIDMQAFHHQFEVNVLGLVKVTQAFLPLLGARENHPCQPGKILQISSVAGKLSMPFLSPYAGSKHAVEGISHSLRRELQLYGIAVVIIGPGAIKTPIWAKGDGGEKYKNSPFFQSLSIFQNVFVRNAIKRALTAAEAAEMILTIFEKPKPKTRYALVSQKFKNWTLPRLFPDRTLDNFVAKNLKLTRNRK